MRDSGDEETSRMGGSFTKPWMTSFLSSPYYIQFGAIHYRSCGKGAEAGSPSSFCG